MSLPSRPQDTVPGSAQRQASVIVSPAQAVDRLRPGQRVFIGTGCGQPQVLVRAVPPKYLATLARGPGIGRFTAAQPMGRPGAQYRAGF